MRKTPSLGDVARRAGVSAATVSRIARGQLGVDAAIQALVRRAAAELGLDLDQKRNGTSTIIAFLHSNRDVLHSFQAHMLAGAQAYCASQEKELLFMAFRYSPTVPPEALHLPQILRRRHLVRAVILGGTNSPNMLAALREQKIPFAVLGNNVVGDWRPEEFDTVYSDDVQGAFDLTSHLIADGHRDIWFIGDIELPWYARCAEGYRQSMLNAGLLPRLSEIQSDDRRLGYLATRSILSRREPVSAIFAGTDQIARGVYEAVHQSGLSVPDDISVAGFNDTEAALLYPPLTSVAEFPEELGRHLAGFALRRAQEPDREPQKLIIPTRVVVRESTKPMTQRGLALAEPNVDPPVVSEL